MRLQTERKLKRGEKAASVLHQEQEQATFFDYARDVPADVRREFEAILEKQPSALGINVSQVLGRPDIIEKMQKFVRTQGQDTIKEYLLAEVEASEALEDDSEATPDLLSKVDRAETRLEVLTLFDEASPEALDSLRGPLQFCLSPERILDSSDDANDALRKLFVAYRLFPEHRGQYQVLAEQRFQECLDYMRDNIQEVDWWPIASNDLIKLWFLCPNKRTELKQFAHDLKRVFLQKVNPGTGEEYYIALIFILTVISHHDAEIAPNGKMIFRPLTSLQKSVPLPERRQI